LLTCCAVSVSRREVVEKKERQYCGWLSSALLLGAEKIKPACDLLRYLISTTLRIECAQR